MTRRENLPVIEDVCLDALRALNKPVPDYDWRQRLKRTREEGPYLKGTYGLPQPAKLDTVKGTVCGLSGTFYLFLRIVRANHNDFTVGLAFTDDAQNGPYRLVRCNGYHASFHFNALEGHTIPPATPHIHFATERYIAARQRWHDGYAEVTQEFNDLDGAIEHLAACVNLVAENRLML